MIEVGAQNFVPNWLERLLQPTQNGRFGVIARSPSAKDDEAISSNSSVHGCGEIASLRSQ